MGAGSTRRRLIVTLALLCLAVAGLSTAAASGAARAGKTVREYPFTASVSWTIVDSFTAACYDSNGQRQGNVTATLHLTARTPGAFRTVWVPKGELARQAEFLSLRRKLVYSISTAATIPSGCPVATVPSTCTSGRKYVQPHYGIWEATDGKNLVVPEPTLPFTQTGLPMNRFMCFARSGNEPAGLMVAHWWPDSYPVFDPKVNSNPPAPFPTGLSDCKKHRLTTTFRDAYSDQWDDSDLYDTQEPESQQATATVTLTRQHQGALFLRGVLHGVPYKPVDGC